MYRLGLRLVARSGREALLRLAVTSLAVGVGVAILLAVLAEFHAFQATSNRPSWESTQGTPVSTPTAAPGAELWNYSENIYRGRFIEQLFAWHREDRTNFYGDSLWVLMMLELWHQSHV